MPDGKLLKSGEFPEIVKKSKKATLGKLLDRFRVEC